MKSQILTVCLGLMSLGMQAQSISLSGEWEVKLGESTSSLAKGYHATSGEARRALLPGTIDTNRLGVPPTDLTETTHLTRISGYKGAARYSRTIEIPKAWKLKKNQAVELFLERTKPTWVYLDGKLVDSCNFISTPQRYILPKKVKSGKHLLEIVVDNSKGVPEQIYGSSHAYTEDTQTNWNGIIGRIELAIASLGSTDRQSAARGKAVCSADCKSAETPTGTSISKTSIINILPCFKDFHIEGAHFYANGHPVFLRGKHDAAVWPLTGHVEMTVDGWMKYLGTCKEYGINHVRFHSWCPPEAAFVAADSLGIYLQPELPFWGSFDGKDEKLMKFLHQEGVNILREYGHHPSFRMMALGNELWGDIDKMKEFVDDFRKIAPDKYYTFGSNYYLGYQGVKPGMDYFTTCRIGGEGWGKYNTHTRGSFSFADAYDGGMINHFHPNSTMNFDEACDPWAKPQPWQKASSDAANASQKQAAGIPIISHETGQFQTYPDFDEMKKYTGVLRPYNFEIFRKRLAAAGMLSQAADFHKASGLWSVKLYKADIEMDLRTKNMAGFQLLDIQDYPGQGSAFVGILDAFMESKGITTPEEWRQWCSPVVPLAGFDKFCFEDGEHVKAKIQIANYGGSSLKGKKLRWHLRAEKGAFRIDDGTYRTEEGEVKKNVGSLMTEDEGVLNIFSYDEGLMDVGELNGVFHVNKPTKLLLSLNIEGTEARNSYELWIYPKIQLGANLANANFSANKKGKKNVKTTAASSSVFIVKDLTDGIIDKLESGAKVLWLPVESENFVASDDTLSQANNATPYTVGGLFQTDYWNYRMFKTICENNKKKVSPGTLGILTNPEHPIFRGFPTEMHTNWQWFPVIKESHPLVLDNFSKDYKPIVQVIDNIERNHKLGLVMEWKVGAGKLLICMSHLDKAAKYPEARAFYKSVLDYMKSSDFNPTSEITVEDLKKTLAEKPHEVTMKELNNISQY
nr:beta-glycosidase [uncultured Prevotella sp.]